MAPKSTCSDCRWWHFQAAEADDPDAGKLFGYCRRFPPSRRENGVGAWPITLGYDWCGEYQERNDASGQVARGGSPPP